MRGHGFELMTTINAFTYEPIQTDFTVANPEGVQGGRSNPPPNQRF